jgi:hypothetical protein
MPQGCILHRDQIHTAGFRAVDGEVIHFPEIVTAGDLGIWVVSVRAGGAKPDCTLPQPASLALHAMEVRAVVGHEVITGVLSKRE